jgi:hydroxyethylthiazole kinase-like uncharacterized protein yjeF
VKVVTPGQMSEIDRVSICRYGIPGVVLMENAALRVVEELDTDLAGLRGKTIVMFAGKGNNGGDVFAAARHLVSKGAKVCVYMLAEKDSIKGDARINLNILEQIGAEVNELSAHSSMDTVKSVLQNADAVVDGIFGTGLNKGVTGLAYDAINLINDSDRWVLAVDIPSGLNGETGKVMGACVKANKTVTFGLPKLGLVVHPGCEYAGELVTADIGIPKAAVMSVKPGIELLDEEYVSGLMPLRYKNSSKGDYGKVLIITGSTGMTGAGALSGRSALRTGAGLVNLGVPSALTGIYDSLLEEAVTIPLEDRGAGVLSRDSLRQIEEYMKGKSVIAVGPGLSVNGDIVELTAGIIQKAEAPLVLDADALNAVSRDISVLKSLRSQAVLTPHPGEMGRLMGISAREVQENRIETAEELSRRWNVVTVLKGSRTVVALPDGTKFINTTGNSGMATGGSGDVLTGIIAGLIAQGLTPSDAAAAGVYIHGYAGDRAAFNKGEHGMTAGDIADELPYVIKELAEKRSLYGI